MRIITFQSKEILSIINKTGEYIVDQNKLAYLRLLPNYKVMRDIMNDKININSNSIPIWCYYRLEGEQPPLDLNCELYHHKGTSGLSNDVVLLELEVPDNQVYLSNYYCWTDYLFFTNEEPNVLDSKLALDNLENYDMRDTIQATIFKITKDMIKSIIFK